MGRIYHIILFIAAFFTLIQQSHSQYISKDPLQLVDIDNIQCGAEMIQTYFPLLKGKSVGIVCNQGSVIGKDHLVDFLVNAGFNIKKIYSPEHGFRGNAEAGAEINSGADSKTGIKIISLYGKNKKPSLSDLEGIDILVFDLQDIGTRFYTYISTLTLVMEAASESGIPLIVLDRPNPNGFYIDGPLLDTAFRSFVGMHPVPVVYGMTIGEYARMINGEKWHKGGECKLTVVPMVGYKRNMIVKLNFRPSPNLPDWQSIYLYPSVCLFEGTFISVGRGTDKPFQVIGHPGFLAGSYHFKPISIPGVAENPPYKDESCYGLSLEVFAENYERNEHPLSLHWLISMHDYFKDSTDFFNSYFDKLAGNDLLKKDIISGKSERDIRLTWEADLQNFRQIRSKYLIYPD
jgi:uncharacterized protein YbbC (DUF1343 family)